MVDGVEDRLGPLVGVLCKGRLAREGASQGDVASEAATLGDVIAGAYIPVAIWTQLHAAYLPYSSRLGTVHIRWVGGKSGSKSYSYFPQRGPPILPPELRDLQELYVT